MAHLPRSVLVIGSGGREHAIVLALANSPSNPQLYCAPGNPGIAESATCVRLAANDIAGLVKYAVQEKIEFVVVGPEVPLALGLVDELAKAGIPAYGPTADGARLEASKTYTKAILQKYRIPTAPAAFFEQADAAIAYVRARPAPIVVKADGLAAGKGVIVAQSHAEAEEGIRALLALPSTGATPRPKILIEDCLAGEETSIQVVVSGRDYVILPTSQDHKRIGEGDTGANTGGMGAYSPADVVTPALLARIEREIVRPSVDAIAAEGINFRGTLFIGLMLTKHGPMVLEYNTRFGDPETQVVLSRIENDVLELLWAASQGQLGGTQLKVKAAHALCVVVAAKGYPAAYPKGDPIAFPPVLPGSVMIIHAGTAVNAAGQLVTAGGRVLGVTALAPTLRHAAFDAYAVCDSIRCATKYFRRDIGARQLARD